MPSTRPLRAHLMFPTVLYRRFSVRKHIGSPCASVWLGLLLVATLWPCRAQAQLRLADDMIFFGQRNDLLFFSHDDSLFRVDVESMQVLGVDRVPDESHFLVNTQPVPNSAIISDSTLWIWDASIGSVFAYNTEGLLKSYPQYPSRTRFGHAATTRPDTGEPLVFGGYGYWRAQDFFIYFDTTLHQWRELAYTPGPHDPSPQIRSSLLDVGNGRDVYLVQGSTSKQVSPMYYVQRPEALALRFDFDTMMWQPTLMNAEVACLISTHAKERLASFRGPEVTYVGIAHPASEACSPLFEDRDVILEFSLLFWRPETGEWAYQPLNSPLPSSRYFVGLQVGDNEAMAILMDISNTTGPRVETLSFPISDSLSWQPLPEIERPPMPWYWPVGGVLVLLLSAVFVWIVWFRRCVYLVEDQDVLLIRRGSLVMRMDIVPNAMLLLKHLSEQPSGRWMNRQELEIPFESMAYAEDALRTTINRAISSINDIGLNELDRELIERQSSSADKRKQEYRLNPSVRCKGRGIRRF